MIEIAGTKLLFDPWLVGPCWGGNIWHYPPPKITPEELTGIDFLYFSHAHDDHFHPQSLNRFNPEVKGAEVIIPAFETPYFERIVHANGFNKIKVMKHDESFDLSPEVTVVMFVNDVGDHDSSLLVQADGKTIFFQTDNLMSIDEAKRIGEKYNIDIVFTIASLTGLFPGFFDFPVETMTKLAKQKSKRALNYSLDITMALGAEYAIPYACDLCYLGELYFANDIHKADKREFVKLAKEKKSNIKALLMGPGDQVEINEEKMECMFSEHDFSMENLGAYASSKRKEIFEVECQERCYAHTSYNDDIKSLRKLLDTAATEWTHESYRVLWKVIGDDGNAIIFSQTLPGRTEECGLDWEYDLCIEIMSYRLQRLVRGDYKMGFVTLENGSIRCHRHVEEFVELEKEFWKWALSKIHFKG